MATRNLTITNMLPITSGVGNYGPWTLYGVDALAEDGTVITETLKTFQELPMNTLIEVECEKKEDEKYGTEYTLKKPKGARYALRMASSDADYEELRQRVIALERHAGLIPPARSDVPAAPVEQPVAAQAGGLPEEDIPFGPSVL